MSRWTKQDFSKFHKDFCNKMKNISESKTSDYTGESESPFHNFEQVQNLGAATTEQGFITRMSDKLSRISSYMEKGKLEVQDESVEDTLVDLANYCALMAGYLKEKRDKNSCPHDSDLKKEVVPESCISSRLRDFGKQNIFYNAKTYVFKVARDIPKEVGGNSVFAIRATSVGNARYKLIDFMWHWKSQRIRPDELQLIDINDD